MDGRLDVVGGRLPDGTAAAEVDARGLVVAPGFIDLHTHSDVSLLSEPGCESAIEQGVTTQAVGLCGFSAAPVSAETVRAMVDEEPVFAFPGVAWDWTTIRGYREAVTAARPATNVTTFVGHNSLRRYVLGSANRPPTPEELAGDAAARRAGRSPRERGASRPGCPTRRACSPRSRSSRRSRPSRRSTGCTYHTHMRYGDLSVRDVRG